MHIYLFIAVLLGSLQVSGQEVYLQLEKANSAKTRKFAVGDAFEYRTAEDRAWQVGRLEQLIPEENLVIFQNRMVALDQITDLRHQGPRRWSGPLGGSLMSFGAGWGLFSLISGLLDRETDPLEVRDAVITGSSAALGYGIQRVFHFKRIRLGGRTRLRLIDLRALRPGVTK